MNSGRVCMISGKYAWFLEKMHDFWKISVVSGKICTTSVRICMILEFILKKGAVFSLGDVSFGG